MKRKKFVTGQSRYCQNCGAESIKLYKVTPESQKSSHLQYCQKCYDKHNAKIAVPTN
ncbi:MAG: hypothetical protein WCV92_00725 [Candidatus Buchananbacteria bacterium]